jgi:hypothetical protein
MFNLLLPNLLPLLAIAHTCTAGWTRRVQVIVSSVTTDSRFQDPYNTTQYVTLTERATILPTATVTSLGTGYLTYVNDGHRLTINVTTTSFVFRPGVALPTKTNTGPESDSPSATPTISTRYFVPVTVSEPTYCSQTAFTYTDSAEVLVPSDLTEQATDTGLATLVTTYAYTTSTKPDGQTVALSRCDVYLHAAGVGSPNGAQHTAIVDGGGYLSDCEDPRRGMCTAAGQNQAATGSGGCNGVYPPSTVLMETSPTDGPAGERPKPNGAGSWRDPRERWALMLPGALILLSLLAR